MERKRKRTETMIFEVALSNDISPVEIDAKSQLRAKRFEAKAGSKNGAETRPEVKMALTF